MPENAEAVDQPYVPLPRSQWTPQEEYVWTCVTQGEVADLAREYGGSDEPISAEDWPDERVLRPKFLETILFSKEFQDQTRRHGVRISCARIREPLDLSEGSVPFPLSFRQCRFENDVIWIRLKVAGHLALEACAFVGALDMEGVHTSASLYMRNAAFGAVKLRSAHVGDQLIMSGSAFYGELAMNSIHVQGHVFMDEGATFGAVSLNSADLGSQLVMRGATFAGELSMDGMDAKSMVFMGEGATFGDVALRGAHLGGGLSIRGSTFRQDTTLDMASMHVEGDVLMRGGTTFAGVDLGGADISGLVEMDGSRFKGPLNMDSMRVGSGLCMRDGARFHDDVYLTHARLIWTLCIHAA